MTEIVNFKGEASQIANKTSLDDEVHQLMKQVGARVRKARELKNIPRRVVSEKSGVSPRYLAQLEAGEGNISIGLLHRVAVALDHRIEWFVGQEDPWTSEPLRIAELFRLASAHDREKVRAALKQVTPEQKRARRIGLIGLRGAGKSTLGAMVGQALHVPFLELNVEIEDHAGMAISEVVALYGQEGYRQLEAQALNRIVSTHDDVILAVAGGVVSDPDSFNALLSNFHTIWVKASPEEHMERVRAQGDMRPMTGNPEAMTQLRSILKSREALYERAEAKLDTTGKPLQQSAVELVNLIRNRGFLGGT